MSQVRHQNENKNSDQQARDPYSPAFAETFGKFLIAEGFVDPLSLQRSARAAFATRERFDHVLTKLGLISEGDLAAQLAKYLGCSLVGLEDLPKVPVLPEIIDVRFAQRHGLIPLRKTDAGLTVAASDPLNSEPCEALAYLIDQPIETQVISPADFERAIAILYSPISDAAQIDVDVRGEHATEFDLQRLRDLASEAPIIRLVSQLIGKAVEAGASDIHIEPGPDVVAARFRLDGVLQTAQMIAPNLQAAVASRIKIMSKLDIAERRLPQDGRIKLAVRGIDIDLRVSTIPTMFGESIVMRILDRRRVELDFNKLGFDAGAISSLRTLMAQPNGILLVTGPTGSGKTTTLYTALKEINRPEVKIFTVEDPIEYQLAGINQVQVQPSIGLGFPDALRSILRQDPDIIMIGEIRDLETAQIAIQASLTGHLVLSTLHTNSAVSSITRLLDMGIEDYLLASTIKGVLAQRLVRRLCSCCCVADPNNVGWAERVPMHMREGPARFKKAVGCKDCDGSGHKGRSTIAELLILDHEMQEKIHTGVSEAVLEARAREAGMRLLYQDGLAKAWRGETSVAEVLRVTRAA